MLLAAIVTVLLLSTTTIISAQFINAECHIEANSGSDPSQPISGYIFLSQRVLKGDTKVLIKVNGFPKNRSISQHGFHVHENGNTSNKCAAAGAHFNPAKVNHGAPTDEVRHVGDLGNVNVKFGKIRAVIHDKKIRLNSRDENSIIGRSIVVHALVDDLGRGKENDSLTTGHAGARLGCCVIKRVTYHNKALTTMCFGRYAEHNKELCQWEQTATLTARKAPHHDNSEQQSRKTTRRRGHKGRKSYHHHRHRDHAHHSN